jgi:hypothetical protein
MTWFHKNGQLIRKFKDEFIDSMISHAYFFLYERKIRKIIKEISLGRPVYTPAYTKHNRQK